MIVLGIETSCDETAAAVVTDAGDRRILANLVFAQLAEHLPYGGVVPEIAARAHLETLTPLIARAMAEAGPRFGDLDGEAFDKTAKLLGLGYPGGPLLERAALTGDAARFALPRPLKGRPGCDFSFSGLKTAVRHAVAALVAQHGALSPGDVADLAASAQ